MSNPETENIKREFVEAKKAFLEKLGLSFEKTAWNEFVINLKSCQVVMSLEIGTFWNFRHTQETPKTYKITNLNLHSEQRLQGILDLFDC
uniref:Uncharacterized protein n=1 Tax=viral metagenome TaxID=1070528 RepID=A0A6C0CAG1_9ZZZZ